MTLVKIEEFSGSITGNAVMETLEIVGVIDALNKRQYNFSIKGVQQPTPKGLIDDEPDSHVVQVEKIKFLGNRQEIPFVIQGMAVDLDSELFKNTMEDMHKADLRFGVTLGIPREEKKYIAVDRDGVWYRHSLELKIDRGDRADVDYVKCMFETIANMVVTSK